MLFGLATYYGVGGHLRFEARLKKFASRMVLTCVGTVVLLKSLQSLIHPLLLRGELVRDLSVAGLVTGGFIGFFILLPYYGSLSIQ